MAMTTDPRGFFTARHATYARFIRFMRYPQGLRTFWLASPLLRTGLRVLEAGCGTGALTLVVWSAAERRGIRLAGLDAFDLTPAMLETLRARLDERGITGVRRVEADVAPAGSPAGVVGRLRSPRLRVDARVRAARAIRRGRLRVRDVPALSRGGEPSDAVGPRRRGTS
jgi:SAM-dependent methyltransferase